MKTILSFAGLCALFLLSCHSSERGNPLDPVGFVPSSQLDVVFDSKTASASLSWDAASERGFASYTVLRRVGQDGVGVSIDTIVTAVDTTFVDTGLQGNTEYVYRVVTRSMEGEEHPTDWVSGGFHLFIDEWRVGEGYPSVPFAIDERYLSVPSAIDIDHEDCVYVGVEYAGTDYLYSLEIRKYDHDGNFLLSWSPFPDWRGPKVMGIACDSEGYVYLNRNRAWTEVVDNVKMVVGAAYLNKFDRDGNFLWAIEIEPKSAFGNEALGVAVDGNDEILVSDMSISPNNNLHRFDRGGQYVEGVRIEEAGLSGLYKVNDLRTWNGFIGFADWGDEDRVWIADLDGSESVAFPDGIGRRGREDGQLIDPISFAVDDAGRFFVLDAGNSRVQVFNGTEYLTKWGSQGNGPGEFELVGEFEWGPTGGIALDSGGNVYVVDSFNNRIQKFGP